MKGSDRNYSSYLVATGEGTRVFFGRICKHGTYFCKRGKESEKSERAPLKRMELALAVLQIVFGKDEKSEDEERMRSRRLHDL
jgi:hypothetical protein